MCSFSNIEVAWVLKHWKAWPCPGNQTVIGSLQFEFLTETDHRQFTCGSLVHLMFDEANHLVVDALKIPITQQQVDIPVLLERHLPFCHTLNCSPYTVEICSRCNQEQTIEKSQVYPKEKCVATVDINLARSSVTCYEQSTVSRWISCSNSISKIDLAIHLHYTSSLLW